MDSNLELLMNQSESPIPGPWSVFAEHNPKTGRFRWRVGRIKNINCIYNALFSLRYEYLGGEYKSAAVARKIAETLNAASID